MIFYLLFFFVPVTIIFLAMAGGCFLYLLMGIRQLTTGYKERSSVKTKSGVITFLIVVPVLVLLVYGYTRLIYSFMGND